MLKNKNKKCEDCIYNKDSTFKHDCAECVNNSNFLSHADFADDMDFWCGDDWDEPKPEEEKAMYFLIRWLIRLILKIHYDCDSCYIRFCGITKKPLGIKQKEEFLPFWLRFFFPFVYIWQYCDGGYSGDCYEGYLYYRLFPFVWLQFLYEC